MEILLGVATIIGGAAAVWFFWDKIRSVFGPLRVKEENIAAFIREGQELLARRDEDPLPVEEHNAWVERMVDYFRPRRGRAYDVRLSDFSGMTFFGDSSEHSKFSNSIDGRLRRLSEFLGEL